MRITNEFTVHTPVERAWEVLTDLSGVAPCLPGAQLTGVDGDVYRGKVKVKVGPVVSDFSGTARFVEKDQAAHRAVIDAKGRDARSAGNAAALVTAVLRSDGDRTLVSVDTELKISGRLAQFGSGMIKEVSGKLLAQFVRNLEAKLAESPDEAAAAEGVPASGAATIAASGSAIGTAPDTAIAASAVDPASAAAATVVPTAERPSAESVTAELVAKEPGAAEPALPAVAGSEPLAASTVAAPGAPTAPPATSAPPAPTASPAASAAPADSAPAAAATAGTSLPAQVSGAAVVSGTPARSAVAEPEPLDLLDLAGGSIYKRAVPVVLGVAMVGAVVIWLVSRR